MSKARTEVDVLAHLFDQLTSLLRDKGIVTDEELDAIRDRTAAQHGIKIRIEPDA